MKDYIKANQRVYDALADEYAERVIYYRKQIRVAQPFIDALKSRFENINVLELGCGAGLNLQYFETEGFATTAVEISEGMIRKAKEIAPKTKYIHGDFLSVCIESVRYEGIFAHAFIHLFKDDDLKIIMERVIDLLAKRGLLFISTTKHTRSCEGFITKGDYHSVEAARFRKQWTAKELMEFFAKWRLTPIFSNEIDESSKGKIWMYFILQRNEES